MIEHGIREVILLLQKALGCAEKIFQNQELSGSFVDHVYPPGMSRAEFHDAAVKNPDLKRFDTVVEFDSEGKLTAVPYSVKYRDILDDMIGYLQEAATKSQDFQFATYLRAACNCLREGTIQAYKNMMEAWLKSRESPICFIIAYDETYSDTMYGLKGTFDAALFIEDPTWSPALEKPVKTWSRFSQTLSFPGSPRHFQGIFSRVYRTLGLTGAIRDMQLRAWNLPNDYDLRTRTGSHQVIIRENTIQAFYEDLLPMMQRLFGVPGDGITEDMLLRGLFWTLAGHELGHNLACYDQQSGLGEIEDVFEELKANIIPVIWAMRCREWGEITGDDARAAVMIYTALDLQDCILVDVSESRRSYCLAALIQMNYLLEYGAAECVGSRLHFNIGSLETVNRRLLREITEIMSGGDYVRGREFIRQYGSSCILEPLEIGITSSAIKEPVRF